MPKVRSRIPSYYAAPIEEEDMPLRIKEAKKQGRINRTMVEAFENALRRKHGTETTTTVRGGLPAGS